MLKRAYAKALRNNRMDLQPSDFLGYVSNEDHSDKGIGFMARVH